MSGLIQRRHEAVLGDISHNTTYGLFSCRVTDSKILPKVVEKVSKEAERICYGNVDTVLVAKISDRKLFLQWRQGKNNCLVALELLEVIDKAVTFMDRNGDI